LSLTLAQDADLLERIFELRSDVYLSEGAYLLRPRPGLHPAQDELDLRSHHFFALAAGRVVAASRFTPCPGGRWELADSVPLPPALAGECMDLVQISRVIVREEYRRLHLTEELIAFACRWLAEHTAHRGWFAMCTPVHVRYYRHFGASVVDGPDVRVPGRRRNRYRFIRGGLLATAETTERFLAAHASGGDGAEPALVERTIVPAAARTRPALAGGGLATP
jgi:hypothetical protein